MGYFRYAERSADTQINWAEVGKNMSDMLKEEVQLRENKKAAIDKASREYGEELSNAPTGDYDDGNTFALEYAGNTQEFRLMQDRLLKSGQLKVKDYTIARQNNIDGTKNLFSLAEEYQKEYSTKRARWEGDESSFREMWEAETVEGLANLRQVKGYTNPTNGVVSIGKMVKNPNTGVMEMSKNPNEFSTVNELRQRLKQQYDRFDMNGSAAAAVKNLGELEQSSIIRAGEGQLNTIITMIDAKKHNFGLEGEQFASAYKDWETTQVSSMMRNSDDVASVLTDKVLQTEKGDRYTFTFDKQEFDSDKTGSLIYLDRSKNTAGEPVFKEEQEQKVREELRLAIRANIDVKRKVTAASFTPYKPKYVDDAEGDADDLVNIANNLGELYYGTAGQLESSSNFLLGLINQGNPKSKAVSINRKTSGVTVTYANGTSRTFSFTDKNGVTIPQDNWITGAVTELTKIKNVDEALEDSRYIKGKSLNKKDIAIAKYTIPKKSSASQILRSHIDSLNIETNNSSEGDWVESYGKSLKELGFDVQESTPGFNRVTISIGPEGNKSSVTIDTNTDGEEEKEELKILKDFIARSLSKDNIVKLISDEIIDENANTGGSASGSSGNCVNGRIIDEETGVDLGPC